MEFRIGRPTYVLPLGALIGALLSAPAAADCGPGIWHLGEEFFGAGDPDIAAVALFRPGAAPPAPDLAVAAGELDEHVAAAAAILDFERYEKEGKVFYALVYDSVKTGEILLPSLDAAGLEAAIGAHPDKHLLDFETFAENGQSRYAALFRQGAASRSFETAVPAGEVAERMAGRQLVDFEVQSRGPGAPTFALLLGPGRKDQLFYPSLDAEAFHQLSHDRHGEYRLADVEVWLSHLGETRFAALFEKGQGADHLFVLACGPQCSGKSFTEDTVKDLQWQVDHRKPALRLADLELPLGAGQPQLGAAKAAAKKAAPPRAAPRPKTPSPAADLPLTMPSGQCHHAGLLHDAGTDGPP